jgi:23S rRNA (uracil1939-C5)-methyltransferase
LNKVKIQKNVNYIVEIEKLVYQGSGMASIDGFKVFVPNGVPGDIVEIRVYKKNRDYAQARILNFVKKSPLRKEAICRHYNHCGGCQVQDVSYQDQVLLKTSILQDLLQRFYPQLKEKMLPIIPAGTDIYYRNKMEYSFGLDDDGIYVGLKERGRFDSVIKLGTCYLQSELANKIRCWVGVFFSDKTASIWDYHKTEGFLRHLVVRHSKSFDEYLINLVVSEYREDLLKEFAQKLVEEFPQVKTVLLTVNNSQGDSVFSEDIRILEGNGFLTEKLGDINYKISPQSFFQTNSKQAEILYQKIVEIAELKKTDMVMDLYCGTASIGIFLSKYVKAVIGVEENEFAIKDGEENIKNNNVDNVKLIAGRVKNVLKFNEFKADCVVLDPPRSGMVPKALKRVIELDIEKIVYVSCNPTTMIRDLVVMNEAGYEVEVIQPVDMFPNTFHIELIARCIKRS